MNSINVLWFWNSKSEPEKYSILNNLWNPLKKNFPHLQTPFVINLFTENYLYQKLFWPILGPTPSCWFVSLFFQKTSLQIEIKNLLWTRYKCHLEVRHWFLDHHFILLVILALLTIFYLKVNILSHLKLFSFKSIFLQMVENLFNLLWISKFQKEDYYFV